MFPFPVLGKAMNRRMGGGGGSLTPAQQLYAYIATLSPLVWHRYTETAGSIAANSGSTGATGNGTYSNATLAQTGQLGANNAFLANALTTNVTIANDSSINALQAFTYAMLVNPASVGESNQGAFYAWDAAVAHTANFFNALTSIQFLMARAGGSLLMRTSTGLTAGQWAWLFFDFDTTNGGKVFKGVSGAVSEFGYGTNSQSSGAVTTTSNLLYVANNNLNGKTFDGLYDEFLIFSSPLSTVQKQQIVNLSGV